MDKIVFVGTCQHNIDEEWYHSDDSSYLILDESSGAYINVTTCRTCKDDNVAYGRVVDPDDIPMDDFVNPFADNPAPDVIKVVNTDGSTTVITMDEEPEVDDKTLGEMFLTNKIH
jgi:hypothetical protein